MASARRFATILLACVACVAVIAGIFPRLGDVAGVGRPQSPIGYWQSQLLQDHPLAGRIWDVRQKEFIDPVDPRSLSRFVRALRVPVALLGEIHDNPDHHRLQAWLIRLRGERAGAIVMEMINEEQRSALAAYLARPDADAAGLGEALGWKNSGWPAWEIYRPIAEAAFAAGLPILPGDPGKVKFREVARQGLNQLSAAELGLLRLDQELDGVLQRGLLNDLYEGHCQLMPKGALDGMAGAQRFRDAYLAQSLVLARAAEYEAGRAANATLIAGNGHTRKDRGVPWYLERMQPTVGVVSVSIVEVVAGEDDPDAYVSGDVVGSAQADFAIFTPRVAREDPCEAMRRKFGK